MRTYSAKIREVSEKYGIPCRTVQRMGLHRGNYPEAAMKVFAGKYRQTSTASEPKKLAKRLSDLGMKSRIRALCTQQRFLQKGV